MTRPDADAGREAVLRDVAAAIRESEHDDAIRTLVGQGATVREEWGCRLTWPDGQTEDHWGEPLGSGRALADTRVALHDGVRTKTTGALIRRYVIVTAATAVEEAP